MPVRQAVLAHWLILASGGIVSMPDGSVRFDRWVDWWIDWFDWWIDHVIFFWFEVARGRSWPWKVNALTFGTAWAILMMFLGLPLMLVSLIADVWEDLS